MRLLADRAAKHTEEGPDQWGRYRALTHAEHIRIIVKRIGLIGALGATRETRP